MALDLLIAARNGIHFFQYSPSFGNFKNNHFLPIENCLKLFSIKGFTYALIEPSPNLKERLLIGIKDNDVVCKKLFQSVGDISTNGELIFVAGETSLICLGLELNEISRVKFFKDWPFEKHKDAHNILLSGNKAYLLDNIETPVFLFIVDYSNSHELKLVFDYEIHDTYAHLEAQYLHQNDNKWFVFQSSHGIAGEIQWAYEFNLQKPKENVWKYEFYQSISPAYTEESAWKLQGYFVFACTPVPESYAVAKKQIQKSPFSLPDSHWGLIEIHHTKEGLDCSDFLLTFPQLEGSSSHDFIIRKTNGFLFVLEKQKQLLFIVQINGKTLKLLQIINLNDYGVIQCQDLWLKE